MRGKETNDDAQSEPPSEHRSAADIIRQVQENLDALERLAKGAHRVEEEKDDAGEADPDDVPPGTDSATADAVEALEGRVGALEKLVEPDRSRINDRPRRSLALIDADTATLAGALSSLLAQSEQEANESRAEVVTEGDDDE